MEERFVVTEEAAYSFIQNATRAFRWVNIFLCEHFDGKPFAKASSRALHEWSNGK